MTSPHLFNDVAFALALVPLGVELWLLLASWRRNRPDPGRAIVMPLCISFLILNLLLVLSLARPLVQPLDAIGYFNAIGNHVRAREYSRAAALSRIALDAYPGASEFGALAAESLMRAVAYNDLRGYLTSRLKAGHTIGTRAELIALARTLRVTMWRQPQVLNALPRAWGDDAALAEAAALVRLEADPGMALDPTASGRLLREAGVRAIDKELGGAARLEGFSVRSNATGRREVTLFFRPLAGWAGRRVWLHAYPAGSSSYVDIAADPPPFDAWHTGELSWEVFELPEGRELEVYVGVTVGDDLGPATALGRVKG